MYIRYLGTKACATLPDGRFVIFDREELTMSERAVCENGGGELPISEAVAILAR